MITTFMSNEPANWNQNLIIDSQLVKPGLSELRLFFDFIIFISPRFLVLLRCDVM
jgi:hypothetical protein